MNTFTFNNAEYKTTTFNDRVEIYFVCEGLEEFICWADQLMSGTFFNRKFTSLENITARANDFDTEVYFVSGGQEQFMFYDNEQGAFYRAAMSA